MSMSNSTKNQHNPFAENKITEEYSNSHMNKPMNIKHKTNKTPTLEYKGLTLKEYFRLSEIQPYCLANQIKQTQQQNACSSKEAVTPYFNQYNGRQKIKTEVFQDKSFQEDKPTVIQKQRITNVLHFENRTKNLKLEKVNEGRWKQEKHHTKGKRSTTLGSNKDHLNRSTITSFYQIQQKKKRMLDKVKHQKQRINQLKLSDAFFITKYAEKFKLNPHRGY